MSRIAIITARGGSKRIPRKNIRPFHGKPVIAYPIQLAKDSGLFDEVMVSTDDFEIAEIAKKYGASVPFMRSPETSNDFAGTLDVLKEVILNYQQLGISFDEMCCIYPVSPLIQKESIIQAFDNLKNPEVDFIIPVCRYSTPVQRSLKIDNGKLLMADPANLNVRSQDLEARFFDVGQFYIAKVDALLKTKTLFSDKTAAFEIDELRVQDVDNEADWKMLEFKYSFLNGTN